MYSRSTCAQRERREGELEPASTDVDGPRPRWEKRLKSVGIRIAVQGVDEAQPLIIGEIRGGWAEIRRSRVEAEVYFIYLYV